MADRHPYERWEHGRERGDDPYDRGLRGGGRDNREPWFGENEEIARRRREEEFEPTRGASPPRERWGTSGAWGDPRSYGSDRDYGDRGYSRWTAEQRARGDDATSQRSREDRSSNYGWRREESSPTYGHMSHGHYVEPGYLGPNEYGPEAYRRPYGRERYGAREWSGVEGWRVPGPHAGRGPRGYQRSDERIQDELHERLTAHGLIDASDVECRVANGEVTLTGFVDSRAAKRAAEDLAEDIYGVRQVRNELRIRSHASGGEGVGRTSVLGLTEAQMQRPQSPAPGAETERPRTRS
jgi:osmotically-inducible protein OsmY